MKKGVVICLALVFFFGFVSAHWGCVGGESNSNVEDYVRRPVVDVELLPSTGGNVTLKITADFCEGGDGNYATFNNAFQYVYVAMSKDSSKICNSELPDGSCGFYGVSSRGKCAVFGWSSGMTHYPEPSAVSLLPGSGSFARAKFDDWGFTYSMEDNGVCVNGEMFHVEREIELTIADYNINYAGGYISVAFGRIPSDTVFSFPSRLVELPEYSSSDFCFTPPSADSCDINFDEGSCNAVNGCYWNTKAFCDGSKFTKEICWEEYEMGTWCEDKTYVCPKVTDKSVCDSAPDRICQWVPKGVCLGTPDICTGLDVEACEMNPNCALGSLQRVPVCGDGYLDDGEECDDANDIDGDGCSASCKLESYSASVYCGDGVLFINEEVCDEGENNGVDSDSDGFYCDSNCLTRGVSLEEPYWADMNGNEVFNAEVGDSVLLISDGLVPNSEVSFEVYEADDLSADDPLFTGENALVAVVDDFGFAEVMWEISEEFYSPDFFSDSEFYFIVDGRPSRNNLEVSLSSEDDPFVLNLISPDCGSDYSVGDTLEIVVNASDTDSFLEGNLSFDGEVIGYFENGISRVYYELVSDGSYTVKATVSDGEKTLSRFSNVIVVDPLVDGTYLAACIDEPKDSVMISDGNDILFNASSTRAVKNVAGTGLTDLDKSLLNFYWTITLGGDVVDTSSWPVSGSEELSYLFYLSLPPGRVSAGLTAEVSD